MDHITISGASQHNLKNISLRLPHNQMIVFTGVSGSGKSTLAFDTLFAEGQRRYLESLTPYARQFFQQLDRPLVEAIGGLCPALAIEHKSLPRNPRSTVGTLTDIHDYLRLLYAHLGTVHCPECDQPVRTHTITQMIEELKRWPDGSRLWILAPLGTIPNAQLPHLFSRIARNGFLRVRIDGVLAALDPPPSLPRRSSYQVEVVVDRLILQMDKSRRLSEALELGSRIGQGRVVVLREQATEISFSEKFQCLNCGIELSKPTISLFSFNHPSGSCSTCRGLGYVSEDHDRNAVGEQQIGQTDIGNEAQHPEKPVCPACQGTRLNDKARTVKIDGLSIDQLSGLALSETHEWLSSLNLSPGEQEIADRPRKEAISRLRALQELGLSYLSLDRSSDTLSGGEAQRIRLIHQISTQLSGVLYVIDEPSVGLHARDHQRLLQMFFRLRDTGNTVLIVEHDPFTIMRADYVVDMGPGSGALGGEVIFAGPPEELLRHPTSLTGLYLSGQRRIPVLSHRVPFTRGALRLTGARGQNLKNITVEFPLGCITCISGVSGAGKSSLVFDTLHRALRQRLHRTKSPPLPFDHLQGMEFINKVMHMGQTLLDRTPRSNLATYIGLFALIRGLYAQVPEAKARGYQPERFSFNVKGGRCEVCKGLGQQRIDMHFLPSVHITCNACQGTRYRSETLDITYKGKTIADVLTMTVHQAHGFFENVPQMRQKLAMLQEVGLGYVTLGQPATTLSGGEAQRVRLARELSRKATGMTLYILDEPTMGLHLEDIQRLLHVLHRLADDGNTVLIIEHNLEVLKSADYLIDLGPEGGTGGGFVVACGTPEQVMQAPDSLTGWYLKQKLANQDTST
jgi:excinuclease ABC subunit A